MTKTTPTVQSESLYEDIFVEVLEPLRSQRVVWADDLPDDVRSQINVGYFFAWAVRSGRLKPYSATPPKRFSGYPTMLKIQSQIPSRKAGWNGIYSFGRVRA